MIQRLIIVGNGFDLNHGLKTSYKDFADSYYYDNAIKNFKKYVKEIKVDSEIQSEWYVFEEWIDKITKYKFDDNLKENPDYKKVEDEIKKINDNFKNISRLLKKYLKEESKKEIKLDEKLKKYFTDESFTITFNYTDTIKRYTNNYYYVHGSINDDNEIVLGFDSSEYPSSMTGEFLDFYKPKLKEKLNFIRFINKKNIKEKNKCILLEEMEEHIDCLFSGMGEYLIDDNNDYIGFENRTCVSKEIIEYKDQNHSSTFQEEYDYSKVKEVLIMGHSLESDEEYLKKISEDIEYIERVILFTYKGEVKDSICNKKKKINKIFGVNFNQIILKQY